MIGTRATDSATGVQQGGLIGPLLFSLAIRDTVKELSNFSVDNTRLDMTTYLDDGMIAGDVKVVAEALRILESLCAALGLKLNRGKNELLLPNDNTDVNLREHFPRDLLIDRKTRNYQVFAHDCFENLGASNGD